MDSLEYTLTELREFMIFSKPNSEKRIREIMGLIDDKKQKNVALSSEEKQFFNQYIDYMRTHYRIIAKYWEAQYPFPARYNPSNLAPIKA